MATEAKIEVTLSNGAKAGQTLKELTKQANTLNKEVKDLKPGTEAFTKKTADLQKVNAEMGNIKNQIKGTTEASDGLKQSFTQFIPFSGTLQTVGQNLTGVNKGVGGLIGRMGLLKTALISTGIGAIVVLLGSLISYLTTTQSGIDKVTAVTRPLSAIFETLKGVLQELGGKAFKALSEAIENPMEALRNLGKIILENVINRFKALALLGPAIKKIMSGDFAEGFKDLGNAALQAVTGVEDVIGKVTEGVKVLAAVVDEAWKKGQRMDQLQKSIEKQEVGQAVRLKTLELLLKQQKDIVEDITKSYEERRVAAENALKTQEAMLNEELSLLNKKIELRKIEHTQNDTSRDQDKELNEMIAKRLELQSKAVDQGIEFKKKINELNKAQAQEELAITQNLQDLKLEVMQEGIEKELEQIQLDTERKIEALIGTEAQITEQKVLLKEIEEQRLQEVKDKYAAIAAAADIKSKSEKEKRDKEAAEKEKELAEQTADFKRQADQAYSDAATDFFAINIEMLSKDEESRKKNAENIKALTRGKILVDLAREVQTIWANVAQYGPFGPAIGAIQTAFAAVRSGMALRRVSSQQFALGGILSGPSHAAGGIKTPYGELEGNEIVLTKGVSKNPRLRAMASEINVAGGGIKFATGGPLTSGPLTPFQGRPPVPSGQINNAGMQASADIADLKQSIMGLGENLKHTIYNIKVQNVATETEAVNNEIKKIQNAADV